MTVNKSLSAFTHKYLRALLCDLRQTGMNMVKINEVLSQFGEKKQS